MSQVLVNETSLTAIADAIREKNGSENVYKPSEMGQAISSLSVGSGGNVPDEISISGHCDYLFSENRFNWLIENYADRIVQPVLASSATHMFEDTSLVNIPITINLGYNAQNMFYDSDKLKTLPTVYKAFSTSTSQSQTALYHYMFSGCKRLREIPDSFLEPTSDNTAKLYCDGYYSITDSGFGRCYSLRKLPKFLDNIQEAHYWRTTFYECHSLDKIENLYFYEEKTPDTENMVKYCSRLSEFTFRTDSDGSPYIANWSNATFDFSGIGYFCAWPTISQTTYAIWGYNSGITEDKEVKDDTTYQALKDDPDWFTEDVNYSRYNHNSAVNTINSLPDTSAYLTENGGTNTIIFTRDSGKYTDGGAINTLSETEIAVATAKGWTLSLV